MDNLIQPLSLPWLSSLKCVRTHSVTHTLLVCYLSVCISGQPHTHAHATHALENLCTYHIHSGPGTAAGNLVVLNVALSTHPPNANQLRSACERRRSTLNASLCLRGSRVKQCAVGKQRIYIYHIFICSLSGGVNGHRACACVW